MPKIDRIGLLLRRNINENTHKSFQACAAMKSVTGSTTIRVLDSFNKVRPTGRDGAALPLLWPQPPGDSTFHLHLRLYPRGAPAAPNVCLHYLHENWPFPKVVRARNQHGRRQCHSADLCTHRAAGTIVDSKLRLEGGEVAWMSCLSSFVQSTTRVGTYYFSCAGGGHLVQFVRAASWETEQNLTALQLRLLEGSEAGRPEGSEAGPAHQQGTCLMCRYLMPYRPVLDPAGRVAKPPYVYP